MILRITWFALVAVLYLAVCLVYARANPPPGGTTSEAWWFRQLKQPNGGSCCAETPDGLPDCHRLDSNLVRASKDGIHWQFKAVPSIFLGLGDDEWHDIPEEVLIRGRKLAELGGNPTSMWVVCAMRGGWMNTGSIQVLCAVPPAGT